MAATGLGLERVPVAAEGGRLVGVLSQWRLAEGEPPEGEPGPGSVVLWRTGYGRGGNGKGRALRKHFVAHWRVWLVIAVVVIVANELVDRNFFDHQEHIDGDVLLAIVALAIAFFGSYVVTRARKSRRSA
ncbi:MAG TPA: hypothetical protein VGF72_10885 [Gaiellaceae bacterium]